MRAPGSPWRRPSIPAARKILIQSMGSEWMIHVVRKARLFSGEDVEHKSDFGLKCGQKKKNGLQLEDGSYYRFSKCLFL